MAEANPAVTEEEVLISLGLWRRNGMPEGSHNRHIWLEEDPEASMISVTDENNVFQDTTIPVPCSSGINQASQIYVEILEEPEDGIKFRYEREKRLPPRIKGENSTGRHKTYPTIKIHGYRGPAYVVVSLIAVRPPYYPHPHRLEGESCRNGVYYEKIDNPEMICCFSDLRMQCVKRNAARESLAQREALQVDPFGTGFSHSSETKKINYNAVRLCFQVLLPDSNGKFRIPVAPAISTPVGNKAVSDLVIMKLSHCSAPVSGGQDVILLCGQVKKDDIEIVFHEENEKGVIWSANGEFSPDDVHKKAAISFKTPAYKNPNIRKNVECFISLRRLSDGVLSKPRKFTLFPSRADPEGIAIKHSKYETLRLPRIRQINDLSSQNSDPEGMDFKHLQYEAIRIPRICQINDLCSQNSGAVNPLHPNYGHGNEFDPPASRSILQRVSGNENTSSPYSKNPVSIVSAETEIISPNTHHTIDGKSIDIEMPSEENIRLLQDDGAQVPVVNTLINSSDLDFNSKDLDGNLSGMTIDSLSDAVGLISVGLIDGKTADEQMTSQDNVISVLFENSGNGGAVNLLHPNYGHGNEFDPPASRSILQRVSGNENTSSPYSKNPVSIVSAETEIISPNTHHTIDGKSIDIEMPPEENIRLLQDDGAQVPVVNTLINSSDLDFNSKDLDGNLSGMTIDSLSDAVGLISVGLIDGKTADEQMTSQDNVISVLFENSGNGG